MHKYNRQQGGTVLGIIIGLVVGLGIALAVAVVITKTPMPFTDKSGRQKASEPTAGQSADPNKPLYGNRAAAKEAAKEFGREAQEPPPENTAAPQPAGKPDGRAPLVEQSAGAGKAKTADAEAKAESGEDKWNYYLQAGAFSEQADAENIRAKLALLGVEARISERQGDTGVLYRVRVGPFGQLESMNKVRGKLSDNGVDAAIVRIAK